MDRIYRIKIREEEIWEEEIQRLLVPILSILTIEAKFSSPEIIEPMESESRRQGIFYMDGQDLQDKYRGGINKYFSSPPILFILTIPVKFSSAKIIKLMLGPSTSTHSILTRLEKTMLSQAVKPSNNLTFR